MKSIRPISSYNTIAFDCDGVILNSNRVKTEAFYQSALPYGHDYAQMLVEYHLDNGGVSRYKKFSYFINEIVSHFPIGNSYPNLESMLGSYASEVRRGLLNCEVASELLKLRKRMPSTRWLIISGGDQSELRDIFTQRGLLDLFDGGIFGSPDSKDEIFGREVLSGNIDRPALFLGDSKYDHLSSQRAGLDFVFVSEWSEFKQWPEYCKKHSIPVISKLSDLIS